MLFHYMSKVFNIDYEVEIGENIWQLWKQKVQNIEIENTKVSDTNLVILILDTIKHKEVLCICVSEHRLLFYVDRENNDIDVRC